MESKKIYLTIDGNCGLLEDLPYLKLSATNIASVSDSAELYELRLRNAGGDSIKLDSIGFRFDAPFFDDADDLAYRFYKEGLTVVGASGSRGRNDCDFELDPGFLRFTVSDTRDYSWKRKGVFHAEQVGVVSSYCGEEGMLWGFVTAENFFCRIVMDMSNDADIHLTAIVDTEGVVLEPGSELQLETFMVAAGKNVEKLLADWAAETARRMNAAPAPASLAGWCSFYYYYGQETEDDILENARFLAENRDSLPLEYIQIDDGWQKSRGDWLETNPDKFPHGMEWLAREIRELGLKPGIWVAPFLVSERAELFKSHQDWLLRDSKGDLMTMGDDYFLDTSHPVALEWLTNIFKTLRDWGYSYFKLDFMMVETCFDARYHDKSITRVQAYRKGLSTIRKAIGDDAFILAGTALMTPNVGLINGSRITTDVTPFWSLKGCTPESPTIFNVCRNMINRAYAHQRLWTNDPDCLIVREQHGRAKYADIPSLTLSETRILASAMILSGGSIFLGDKMSDLPASRIDILREVFKLLGEYPAFPVDRMMNAIPRVWLRTGEGGDIPLLALFNWGEKPVTLAAELALLDEPPTGKLEDVWTGESFDSFAEIAEHALPSRSCLLLKLERK